jgi:pimeloyl-ACP methyl ester carboxylesterase
MGVNPFRLVLAAAVPLLCGAGWGAAIPPWNAADRTTTLNWFLENEYGVRPTSAETAKAEFAAEGDDRVMMDGAALRKRVRITMKGPRGDVSFVATAFIPTATKGPVPSFLLICNRNPEKNIDPDRVQKSPFWPAEEIVRRGYAAISFYNGDVAPDRATGCSEGVFRAFDGPWIEKGENFRPHDAWGTLSAWAWGASRVMDWIAREPRLDAGRVAVIGHSRGGKTALLAGVTDPRFAMACVNGSGCGGAKLNRMELPKSESIAQITRMFPYWFCSNYRMWVNRDREVPFDQHQFLALMAPRLVAVGDATEDDWAGPRGEYECCVRASGAWEAQGKGGLVSSAFPAPDTAQQDGSISYHLRTGGHDLTALDWARYMDFADRHGWKNGIIGR